MTAPARWIALILTWKDRFTRLGNGTLAIRTKEKLMVKEMSKTKVTTVKKVKKKVAVVVRLVRSQMI